MLLDAKKTMIAWNPGTDQIKVGPLLGYYDNGWRDEDWTKPYLCIAGAAFTWVRSAGKSALGSMLKAEFIAIVVRDGVCIRAAYREFSKIRQFRDTIPEDMPSEM